MSLVTLKCPNCGGQLEFENSREFGFCGFCGYKVMIQQEINNTVNNFNSTTVINQDFSAQNKRMTEAADKAFNEGDYRSATEIANDILSHDPTFSDAHRVILFSQIMMRYHERGNIAKEDEEALMPLYNKYHLYSSDARGLKEIALDLLDNTIVEGKGKKIYGDGYYEGEFRNNLRNGNGKYVLNSGEVFNGQWENDAFVQGCGKKNYADGYYEGEFTGNCRHGKGKYVWNSGEVFDGQWENDAPIEGQYSTPNGDLLKGKFDSDFTLVEGIMHKVYKNGTYEGQCRNGMRHGKGKMVYNTGNWYDGEWSEDYKHGVGVRCESDKFFGKKRVRYDHGELVN